MYGIFTRLSGSSAPRRTDCLLIGADYLEADAGDSVWLEALNRLNAMGARQIVFTSCLPEFRLNFIKELNKLMVSISEDKEFGVRPFKKKRRLSLFPPRLEVNH